MGYYEAKIVQALGRMEKAQAAGDQRGITFWQRMIGLWARKMEVK